jgi:transposase
MFGDYQFYVGIDWATQAHQVCVIDGERHLLAERTVDHDGLALTQFVDWLGVLTGNQPQRVAVAIEMPRGAIVEVLVERGFAVFSVNPKQLDRFRDRHTVAGAKDDSRDAFVLADSLRTDEQCFRCIQLDDPRIIQIRELTRIEEDLKVEFSRLTNRLREQLHRYYPQLLRLSPAADEPWLWDLIEIVPTPEQGARLPQKHLEKLLREHRIRRLTAEDVERELQALPITTSAGTIEAAKRHCQMLIPRLRLLIMQRKQCAEELDALLDELSRREADEGTGLPTDTAVLRSLPGVGRFVAATVLSEAAQLLEARDYESLRAHSGIAPVTRRSGKRGVVVMRRSCNRRLRYALYHWARSSVKNEARSRASYEALRQRGHSHGRALRSVADQCLRMLMAMLKTATLYDEARRCEKGKLINEQC